MAAQHLNRTQSAISVQLRRLEEHLDVTLFDRHARGMVLNDAGQQLLPKAISILAQIREVGSLFADPLTGSIRVGFPDDFDDTILEQVLQQFSDAHPGVNVIAASGCTSSYPAAVNRGDLDIAVYSGVDNDEGTFLCTEKCVWAKKPGTQIDKSKPIPLAVLDRQCWWQDLPTNALNDAGIDYVIAFRSSNFASLQAAIRAGFAVGILPMSCIGNGTTIVPRSEGLPELPISRRSILSRPGAPEVLIDAMTAAIRDARLAQPA